MATTKKAPTKKSSTTQSRAKKAPAVKKTTAKRPTTVRRATPAAPRASFMTLTPTVETVYWAILGGLVIVLAIWVATLTIQVQNIYNQIEITNAQNGINIVPKKHTAAQ